MLRRTSNMKKLSLVLLLLGASAGFSLLHVSDRAIAGANGQKSMAAADDRLIRVIGVEMEAATRENAR